MADRGHGDGRQKPVVIRKYANRRLYNTATAGFVTLDDLRRMVSTGEDFTVVDAQSGRDITASVLAQIIAEQETRGESLLPVELLKQAISLYQKGMGPSFADYLERSMSAFAQGFERMGEFGEIGRRNMELFQRSFGLFATDASAGAPDPADKPAAGATEAADLREQVDILKQELRTMQQRLDALSARHPAGRSRRKD